MAKVSVYMIKRDFYLNKLIHSMWNDDVKVITGIRRCGKSVVLFDLFYNYLLEQGVNKENIIKIQLDQRKYSKYRNPITLCNYIENIVLGNEKEKYYLFIDEVQLSRKVKDKENDFEDITLYDMLNELKSYPNLDIYVTGSNSKMLSNDIATEFRGRATQVKIFPFSFEEYYNYVGGDEYKAFNQYLIYGGMPKSILIDDESEKKDYLSSLYKEIYIKDLVERNHIEREDLLNNILDYLASQISSLTNPTNISSSLSTLRKEKINPTLVSNYIKHCEDAFLIKKVERYDIKGKSYFSYPYKYYYIDVGLRNARLNYRQFDPGHIMENIIYIELLRRGYSVDIGVVVDRRNDKKISKEIDFIVNDNDKKVYIQSSLKMDNDNKLNSEVDSLLLTKDFFKKIIIRNDIYHNYYDDNGVLHLNIIDFLLNRVELF